MKQGEDKRFIIVDGAMNDLIRPTLYEAWHRIEPADPLQPATGKADIVGPVCETGDYLGQARDMPDIAEGDVLAVFSAGAYGAVMMSTYNTRPTIRSIKCPSLISAQVEQASQGSEVTPSSQFRHLAKIRASVVLPTPRVPVNK